MLVVSERHTKDDLYLWDLYSEIDQIKKYSTKKLNTSKNVLKEWFCRHKDCVLFTSWGKDSVMLMHIIHELGLNMPMVHGKFEVHNNPDTDIVRDEFLKKYDVNYIEEVLPIELKGNDKDWNFLAKKYSKYRITGLRNQESNIRKMVFMISRYMSEYSCRPLSLFKSDEVFAYIEQNGIPLCPVYGYLGGGRYKRHDIRTHSLGEDYPTPAGRLWEKEYYQNELNIIQKMINV